jgi:hypothetical protein
MTEINTYKCDFCGQTFDDEEECIYHEWKCRYEELCRTENCELLRLFYVGGDEIDGFNYPDRDEIGAVEVHSYAWAQFINDYFDEQGYEGPIHIVMGQVEHYGLWYFDPEYHYGEWRSYEEVLEDIQEIGKKFNQGA